MFSFTFVCLLAGLHKATEPIVLELDGRVGCVPRKVPLL